VIAEFRAIAVQFNIAIILVHHTRKGIVQPGDADVGRGASSPVGAARVVKTLVTMTEEDAEAFGLPKSRQARSRFVRLDDAKQNYAAIDDAEWFEKVIYTLDNGEAVAAAVPWQPPDIWADVSPSTANRILDDLEAGFDGRRYSDAPNAGPRAAWPIVQKHLPNLNDQQARKVIKTWIENHVLLRVDYDDATERKPRQGLRVNPAKRPGSHA
jgi:hypothetical protein